MKGIKKTLMAGFLACGALNYEAKAEGVPEFSYGINLSASLSAAVGYDDAVKFGAKDAENQYFDCLWFTPELYAGYAFSDYVGVQLNAAYMKQGGSLQGAKEKKEVKETDKKNDSDSVQSIAMYSHGIYTGLHLSFYPLGFNKGEDSLRLSVGPSMFIPFATACKNHGKDIALSEELKKQIGGLDLGLSAMVEYEFSCGVSIVGRYIHGFMNRLNIEEGKTQKIFKDVEGLKKLRNHSATIGVGYNFASLFSE